MDQSNTPIISSDRCAEHEAVLVERGPHTGLYCRDCCRFICWVTKKQAKILRQIRKIEQL